MAADGDVTVRVLDLQLLPPWLLSLLLPSVLPLLAVPCMAAGGDEMGSAAGGICILYSAAAGLLSGDRPEATAVTTPAGAYHCTHKISMSRHTAVYSLTCTANKLFHMTY